MRLIALRRWQNRQRHEPWSHHR